MRYLSLEEDQALRANCEPLEPFGGCVFMPRVQFERMLRELQKAKAGQGI